MSDLLACNQLQQAHKSQQSDSQIREIPHIRITGLSTVPSIIGGLACCATWLNNTVWTLADATTTLGHISRGRLILFCYRSSTYPSPPRNFQDNHKHKQVRRYPAGMRMHDNIRIRQSLAITGYHLVHPHDHQYGRRAQLAGEAGFSFSMVHLNRTELTLGSHLYFLSDLEVISHRRHLSRRQRNQHCRQCDHGRSYRA